MSLINSLSFNSLSILRTVFGDKILKGYSILLISFWIILSLYSFKLVCNNFLICSFILESTFWFIFRIISIKLLRIDTIFFSISFFEICLNFGLLISDCLNRLEIVSINSLLDSISSSKSLLLFLWVVNIVSNFFNGISYDINWCWRSWGDTS